MKGTLLILNLGNLPLTLAAVKETRWTRVLHALLKHSLSSFRYVSYLSATGTLNLVMVHKHNPNVRLLPSYLLQIRSMAVSDLISFRLFSVTIKQLQRNYLFSSVIQKTCFSFTVKLPKNQFDFVYDFFNTELNVGQNALQSTNAKYI